MRICRITRLHPRTGWPASGLTAFNLSRDLPHPCLYITKDMGDEPLPFPANVRPKVLSYPEPRVPEKPGGWRLLYVSLGKILGSLVFLAKALPHMARFKPHIIHIHTPLPLLLGIVGKLAFRTPLVLTFQGTDYYRVMDSRILQYLIRTWVDTIICVSQDMEPNLNRMFERATVVHIPNAVDTDLFYDQGLPRQKQIIAVGRLVWQKGYEFLLPAVRRVIDRHPDFRLVIVGDGPLREEIASQAEQLGISESVSFAGILDQPQIATLLNQSRLYVLSSVIEGLPKALLEAMACGTPAVVTDVGDCGLVAHDSGLVVPTRQPEALAEAMLKMLEGGLAWQRASAASQESAKEYSWEARAQRVLVEYERLVGVS